MIVIMWTDIFLVLE